MPTPEEIDNLRQSALDARNEGDHEKSLAQFQELLRLHPGDQRSWIDSAISLRELSRHSEARHVLLKYLATGPASNWRSLAIDNLIGIVSHEVGAFLRGGNPDAAVSVFEGLLATFSEEELSRHSLRIWTINFQILGFLGLETALYKLKRAELAVGTVNHEGPIRTLLANHAINNGWFDDARTLIVQDDDALGLRLHLADARARTSMVDIDDEELIEKAKRSGRASFRKAAWNHELYAAMYRLDGPSMEHALTEIDASLSVSNTNDRQPAVSATDRFRNVYARSFLSAIELIRDTSEESLEERSKSYLAHDRNCRTHEERVSLSQFYLSHVVDTDHIKQRMLPNTAAAEEVPRAIVQFWDSRTLPGDVERCCRTWKAVAQRGFHYSLFNEEDAEDWLARTYGSEVSARFRRAGHPAMKADLFRIFYLYENGGIYIDADEFCKSLPPFFEKALRCVRLQRIVAPVELPNMYLSLAKKDPLLHEAMEIVIGMPEEELFNGRIWWNTGPGLFSIAFARLHARAVLGPENSLPWLIPMPLYTRHVFSPQLDYKSTAKSWQFQLK
ncbi:glycosyltransferase [Jiella pacifica]|uniref:Tetratricopeptide repeat protein n=1 Tax=Jiella pacifica TaxID=2696469 RepID=A0A6N9T705_9HYPH|nr:tetratricopeptide repeat protein [Jiella pacifica]NDW07177.1 tetratricopeptide repeat protein [Jiella pacifica]